MACERYREALTDLAVGAPAADGLEAHIATCAACREELGVLRRALEAVDADLRPLASAEPSPALAARIRRAAADTEVDGWHLAFALRTLAAGVVLAALAFLVLRGHEPATTPVASVTPRPQQADGTPAPPAPGKPEAPPPPLAARAVEATRHPSALRQAALPESEVLVPPGQVEALLRLVVLVNRQRVASPSLAAVDQGSPDLAEPRPIDVGSIDITPLEIVPLDPAESAGT